MTWRLLAIFAVLILLIGIAIGLLIGYHLWHVTPAPAAESVAAEVRQHDGSVVLVRVPVPFATISYAVHQIPPDTVEERRGSVTIQPVRGAGCMCGPVTVDWSLVRGDDGRRMVVSSPDGEVVTGIDIPILLDSQPDYRNALGVTWRPEQPAYGVMYQRDLGRVRLGVKADVVEDGRATLSGGEVNALWRW